jgi:hypothetical protein
MLDQWSRFFLNPMVEIISPFHIQYFDQCIYFGVSHSTFLIKEHVVSIGFNVGRTSGSNLTWEICPPLLRALLVNIHI